MFKIIVNFCKKVLSLGKRQVTIRPKTVVKPKPIKKPQREKLVVKVITKNVLMDKLKLNMFFLTELALQLEKNPKHINYYYKVMDLKKQSNHFFKILDKLTEDKPYYNSVLETAQRHVEIVGELLK